MLVNISKSVISDELFLP